MHRRAFTLIELLVVIAIIAILAVVVVLTLNPAQLLEQSRDSNRLSDMADLTNALGLYSAQGGTSLGNPNTVYVSIADPTATSTAGDQCQGLGLISLPAGYTYQCPASSTLRLVNGTGWIPVNFATLAAGAPLPQLPIDPTNTSSSREYYTYETNGTQFEVTSVMESQKYQLGGSNDVIGPDGGTLASVYEKGTKLGLEPLDYGDPALVGLWSLDEGTGTVAYDYSGNNATGSWSGAQAGTDGYYSPGRIGAWAGFFNNINDEVTVSPVLVFSGQAAFTISAWYFTNDNKTDNFIGFYNNAGVNGWTFELNTGELHVQLGNGVTLPSVTDSVTTLGSWSFGAATWNGATLSLYRNGLLVGAVPDSGGFPSISSNVIIGGPQSGRFFDGLIDDVRIYNRALTAAQIAAMYSGGK